MRFEVSQDRREEWRWSLKGDNYESIAVSGEGYTDKSDCMAAIKLVKGASEAEVITIVNLDTWRR